MRALPLPRRPAAPPVTVSAAVAHLIAITPPRESAVLWPAQAELIAGLRAALENDHGIALEIAGRGAEGVRYFARAATPRDLRVLERKFSAFYPQALIRRVTDRAADPAAAMAVDGALAREFRLRGPVERPLRPALAEETPRQILALLRDLHRLPAGVAALCQLILWPAPTDWGERVEDDVYGRDLAARAAGGHEAAEDPALLSPPALAALMLFAGTGSLTYGYTATGHALFLAGALLAALVVAAGGVVYWRLRTRRRPANVALAAAKTAYRGYTARLRIAVAGGAPEDREAVLTSLTASYAAYEQANSNGFVHAPCDPTLMDQLTMAGAAHAWRRPPMILNAAEVAALCRLPQSDEDVPGVQRRLTRVLYPAHPAHQRGLPIGVVPADGPSGARTHLPHDALAREPLVPVYLPYSAVETAHMVVLGSTGGGKSTYIQRLIWALKVAEGRPTQVIVIDPHSDLVQDILGWYPFGRGPRPIVLRFSDPDYAFGYNPLDVTMGRGDDQIVGSLVTGFSRLWESAWGSRMEDAFRHAVVTLLEANHERAPDKQYTVLDISDLLQLRSFRAAVLQEVRSFELLKYWRDEFDAMTPQMHEAQVKPVLTKIGRFRASRAARRIFGQRRSTINIRDMIASGASIFIDSDEWALSADTTSLLDSLFINELCDAISERPKGAPDALLVVDEFQHAPARWKENFRNIRKRGGRIVVAAQSLGAIEEVEEGLKANVVNNTATGTKVIFSTGDPDDTEYLARVLDEAVTPVEIQNLPVHECYIKTSDGPEKLPVVSATIPLPPPSTEGSAAFLHRASVRRFAVPGEAVDRARRAWLRRLYFGAKDDIDVNPDYANAELNADMMAVIRDAATEALAADRAADAAAHPAAHPARTAPAGLYSGTAPATPGPGRADTLAARRAAGGQRRVALADGAGAEQREDGAEDAAANTDEDHHARKPRWDASRRAARAAAQARVQPEGAEARRLSVEDGSAAGGT